MSSRSDAVAGGAAGAAARVLTAPLDLLKIRFQLQSRNSTKYNSMIQATHQIIRSEGLWAMWKGNISATLLWTTYGAVQFTLYGAVQSALLANTKLPYHDKSIAYYEVVRSCLDGAAGAVACAGSTFVSYPFDISRTQFAAQGGIRVHESIFGYIAHTINTSGITGLYSGFGVTMIGAVPYMGMNFALYGLFQRLSKKIVQPAEDASSHWGLSHVLRSSAICGAVSGGLSKFLVYPLDTLKRRFQAQVIESTFHINDVNIANSCNNRPYDVKESNLLSSLHPRKRYNSIMHGIKTILKEEGIKGFYKGLAPSIWKAIVATSINFQVYEAVKATLV